VISFLLRRLIQAVIVLVIVMIITFILIHLLPGSPARAALGLKAAPPAIAAFNRQNGYDKPLVVQFFYYVGRVAQGNFGYSYIQNQTVLSLIAERLPKDIVLIVASTILSLVVSVPLGLRQALRRNTLYDYTVTGLSFFYSMPVFFLAFLLIVGFSVQLHLLPAQAPQSASIWTVLSQPQGLVLPVVTLAFLGVASTTRYMRSSAIENLAEDYIRTARAKSLPERRVLARHLLRNAIGPIVTLLGLTLPSLVAGALVIEQAFNFPGLGLLFYQATTDQDYPILLGLTMFVGIAIVVGNLLADIGYALLDPRIRLE